jgi:hypothetical protein
MNGSLDSPESDTHLYPTMSDRHENPTTDDASTFAAVSQSLASTTPESECIQASIQTLLVDVIGTALTIAFTTLLYQDLAPFLK